MATRVTVFIRNQRYRILAEESEAYIQECASMVTNELDAAMANTTLSLADGAVLASLNLADKYSKERQVADNLREQLKQALDENARLTKELETAKKKKTTVRAVKATKQEKDKPQDKGEPT